MLNSYSVFSKYKEISFLSVFFILIEGALLRSSATDGIASIERRRGLKQRLRLCLLQQDSLWFLVAIVSLQPVSTVRNLHRIAGTGGSTTQNYVLLEKKIQAFSFKNAINLP